MMRDGYEATYRGVAYEASPDGDLVRLYSPVPANGFARVAEHRFRCVVRVEHVQDLCYVRTTCRWREAPFIVLGEHDGWLRVEYTGGKAPVALGLGLEEFDFGVYQGWAPATEVTEVREYRV
ncbi:MAG TPA: hypothetical protein VFR11_00310 [Micromonosporaceae bacterium]|nr:hypothetical protein [Micromonosporaceae bacterium]